MAQVHTLPRVFPLHEDRDFLSESEWVILRLLCRPLGQLATSEAAELSRASGGQISEQRAQVLIQIARIAALPGLGTWIARLMAEAGLTEEDVHRLPAAAIVARINTRTGYGLCNRATEHAITRLQREWNRKFQA